MNRKLIIFTAACALAVPTAIVFANFSKMNKTDAYSTSSLPSTIDLNDTKESVIRNYYSAASGYRGDDLLIHLKEIIKNGQKYYSYDTDNSGRKIWQIYEIADRDWEKSPASAISGYNAKTNTITGYIYGQTSTNNGMNPYLHALYVNREKENYMRAWTRTDLGLSGTSHGNNAQWAIDREHIWPKSHGFEDEGQGGARGDPMHLWPGDSYVNSDLHSNYYYGYVDLDRDYKGGLSKYDYIDRNYRGYSRTLGGSTTVFEPQDSDKGDIARAVFYMVARYNYLSGSDSDGIDTNNPNLTLTNSLSDWRNSGYMSSTTTLGKLGIVSDLLEWNRIDPPDEFEIHRNNLLYINYTNNRNPFIDFPQWAEIIWGEQEGYADPANDSLNNKGTLKISNSELTIDYPSTGSISATVPGSTTINWSISDSTVASLSKSTSTSNEAITITPLKKGNATITASAVISDETKTAQCELTINAELTGIEIKSPKTSYGLNDEFVRPQVIATYVTGEKEDVSTLVTYTGNDTSSPSESRLVTASYTEGGITKTDSYYINVNNVIDHLSVSGQTTTFKYGDTFEFDGVAKLVYQNGAEAEVTPTTITDPNMEQLGKQDITVTYGEGEDAVSTTYTITIKNYVESITVSGQTTEYRYGDVFEFDGTLKANYADGTSETVTPTSISEPDMDQIGSQEVTVSYTKGGETLTVDFEINVSNILTGISASGQTTDFFTGDTFEFDGTILASYINGETKTIESGFSCTVDPSDMDVPGNKTVTISYTEGSTTKTASYTITVSDPYPVSISISGQQTQYKAGDTFVKPSVTLTYDNGDTEDVTDDCNFTGYDLTKAGEQTVIVTYELDNGVTLTATYKITVESSPIPISSGCGGNVMATSIILSTISLIGIVLILLKKKKA